MAVMGRFCKAYVAGDLRRFGGWTEDPAALRPAEEAEGGEAAPRARLEEDDVLYLQENLVVTDGIFMDEHVVFAAVTPAWEAFCRGELGFAPPPDLPPEAEDVPAAAAPAGAAPPA